MDESNEWTEPRSSLLSSGKLFYRNFDRSDFKSNFIIVNKRNCETGDYRNIIETIFRKKWALKSPDLLIMVTGGTYRFQLTPSMRAVLRKLARTAKDTNAWIFTSGTHQGLIKYLGQAVHEFLVNDQQFIPLVGFSTLDVLNPSITTQLMNLKNRTIHDDLSENQCLSHEVEIPGKNIGLSFLDKNHSHFVLVTNSEGQESEHNFRSAAWGSENMLRSFIEEYIITFWNNMGDLNDSSSDSDNGENQEENRKSRGGGFCNNERLNNLKRPRDSKMGQGFFDRNQTDFNSVNCVPSILISIQGGPRTLMTILRQLKRNGPVLVIKGPGGWSDVIADLCQFYQPMSILQQMKMQGCIFGGLGNEQILA